VKGKVLALLLALLLAGCGGSFQKWQTSQAIDAFKGAGLEVESARPMTEEDYGMAPVVAEEATRFFIPSCGDDCGGRIFSFSDSDSLFKVKFYYNKMSEGSELFFCWVFEKDNILVQLDGDLPEEKANLYGEALKSMK